MLLLWYDPSLDVGINDHSRLLRLTPKHFQIVEIDDRWLMVVVQHASLLAADLEFQKQQLVSKDQATKVTSPCSFLCSSCTSERER